MTGVGMIDVNSNVSLPPQKFTLIVFVATVLSATGCLLFGYDTGIVSGSMIYIKDEFKLTSFWQEIEVSITIIAACIFSGLAGPFNKNFGRKKVILSASGIFSVGSIVMAVSWEKYSLLVGRFIAGAGIGFASTVVPCYIAEMAPNHVRGSLVTMSYVAIVLGQLIAAVVAGLCSYLPDEVGWRYMLGIAAVPAGLQFVGFFFMPESPRWLVQHKRCDEAIAVLQKIRGTQNVKEEFKHIQNEVEEAEQRGEKSCVSSLLDAFSHQNSRRALIVGSVLWATHELSGINVMMYYTATIVQMAGVYDKTMAVWYAAAIDVVYTISTGLGMYLVEKMGRRKLLISSVCGTIISSAVIGAGFMITERTSPNILGFNTSSGGCLSYSSCGPCAEDFNCGFCFSDGADLEDQYPGKCLPADLDDDGFSSLIGQCGNGSIIRSDNFNTVWAYDWCPSSYSWVIIASVVSYLIFFGPGLGAMSWTINSEIYPLESRAACNAFVMGVNWATQTLITLTFLTLTEVLGKPGCFWLYGGFAVLGGSFLFLTLPETRGRSLEETSTLFAGKSWIVAFK